MLRFVSLTWRRVELPTTEASCDDRRRWRFPAKHKVIRNLELLHRTYCDTNSNHQLWTVKLKMMAKQCDLASGGGLQGGENLWLTTEQLSQSGRCLAWRRTWTRLRQL